jgi:hypothetical protein
MGPGVHAQRIKLGKYLWEHLPPFLGTPRIGVINYKAIGGLDKISEGLEELKMC